MGCEKKSRIIAISIGYQYYFYLTSYYLILCNIVLCPNVCITPCLHKNVNYYVWLKLLYGSTKIRFVLISPEELVSKKQAWVYISFIIQFVFNYQHKFKTIMRTYSFVCFV